MFSSLLLHGANLFDSTDAGLRSMILYTVLQSINNAECLSQFPSAMLSSVH